ncbi:hypothetical protein [Streptomyces sp. NPDC057363]|uniref:hypothetical protein n=1 Tax=Streptomyces sp. NPDC057363 TaxID=3346107 RepID=UPI00362FEE16
METQSRFDDMAYGPIGKAVKDVLPYTEADPIGVYAGILSLYSAAVNGYVTQSDGKRPCCVWTVLAGRSSVGRKGTALEAAEHMLSAALGGPEGFLSRHLRKGISSGPSLVNVLHEAYEKSLTSEGGPDGRVVLIEDEWQNQLRRTTKCPTFSGQFRTIWDGKVVSNTTKGKKPGEMDEQRIDSPKLGFHAHITPGTWAKFVSSTEALGGSFNRLLPVMVRYSKILPSTEESPLLQVAPSKALKLAYDWARKEPRIMTLSVPARKRFDELRIKYLEETEEMPEVLASYFERSAEQVWRVAAILTAANRRTVIPKEAIEAASHFVDYSVHSVTQLVNQSGSSKAGNVTPLDEKIRRCLERHGGEMTRTALYRSVGSGRFTAAQVEAEALEMPDVEVEVRDSGRSGAKPTYIRLVTAEPDTAKPEATVPAPRPAEAEQLLDLYAAWAGKPENQGKSLTDFLTAQTASVQPPAKKTAAKRSAAPRKASKSTASSSGTTSTRTRGTAAKKTAAKTAAKKTPATPAKRAVSAQGAKKSAASAANN